MIEFTEKERVALNRLMNDHIDMGDIYGLNEDEWDALWAKFSTKEEDDD